MPSRSRRRNATGRTNDPDANGQTVHRNVGLIDEIQQLNQQREKLLSFDTPQGLGRVDKEARQAPTFGTVMVRQYG